MISTFYSRLSTLLNNSPLGMIKGDCRFLNSCPDDIETDDPDYFDKNDVQILFAYGEKILGQISPKQNEVESCSFTNGVLSLTLRFKGNEEDDYKRIYIQFSYEWPHKALFGEYMAANEK